MNDECIYEIQTIVVENPFTHHYTLTVTKIVYVTGNRFLFRKLNGECLNAERDFNNSNPIMRNMLLGGDEEMMEMYKI